MCRHWSSLDCRRIFLPDLLLLDGVSKDTLNVHRGRQALLPEGPGGEAELGIFNREFGFAIVLVGYRNSVPVFEGAGAEHPPPC